MMLLWVACAAPDPLFTFAPLSGYEHVELEAEPALGTAGNITDVDHPDRPSGSAYVDAYPDRTLVVNGLLVPSVARLAADRDPVVWGETAWSAPWTRTT